MTEAEIRALINMILPTVQNGIGLIAQIQAAFGTNDQSSLDTLRAQALAFANAEAPAGAAPLT